MQCTSICGARSLEAPELLSLEDSFPESLPESLRPDAEAREAAMASQSGSGYMSMRIPSYSTARGGPLAACLQLPAQCRLESLIKELMSLPKPQVPQCDTFR